MAEEPEDDFSPDDFAHLLSPLSLAVSLTRGSAEPYQPARHLILLNEALKDLHARRPGVPRRLMIVTPPRHGKSELISHWFPAWALADNPATKIILTSHSLSLAAKYGRMTKNTIRDAYPVLGARVQEDSRAAHRWTTKEGGGMESRGIGGAITGLGFNIGIIDDPIKDDAQAQSKVIRDTQWAWWETTFRSRADKDDAIFVLVMTRWHQDDLAGRLLASEPELWRVIHLPALAEAKDPLGREPDEALWPEREPKRKLEEIRKKSPRVFNALYQGRPSPPEGAAIQRDWWRRYTERQDPLLFDQLIQTWDPTFKDVGTSDYVAAWILGRRGQDVFVLDGLREHLNAPKTIRAIKRWREMWPTAKRILIEESASGPAIIQLLEHEVSGITPVGTGGRSKEQRLHWGANSVAGYIEGGRVWLPQYDPDAKQPLDPRLGDLAQGLIDEAAEFPFGAHDDQLDAFVQGCQFVMPRVWASERAASKAEIEALGPKNPLELEKARLDAIIKKRLKENQKALSEMRRSGDALPGLP